MRADIQIRLSLLALVTKEEDCNWSLVAPSTSSCVYALVIFGTEVQTHTDKILGQEGMVSLDELDCTW